MATLQKRGDKWRAIIRRQGFPAQSKTFTAKARAERWAREVEGDMDNARFRDPRQLKGTTFGKLIKRYRQEMPAPGRTKDACLRLLERGMGDVPLSELTKQRIVAYGRARADEGAGPATLAQDLIYLRGVIQTAAAHWDVPVSVETVTNARTVLRDQGLIALSNERDRRPTDDELELLRQYWERTQVRKTLTAPMMDIVQFAIASCMRLSEVCAIRWDDIDEADRTILIRDRKHPSQKIGNNQTVPLLGDAWTIVQRQPRTKEELRIFPFKPDSLSANFTRAVLRTRIDDLHFHDTRHHGISLLFEAGYQLHEVALVSGHRDWKQLARYT
ncbi:MAG: site-specific integrase, partial [Thiohalocapsa sp.]